MVIIDSLTDLTLTLDRLKKEDSLIIPILCDHVLHPKMNNISCLCIQFDSDSVLIPFDHNESFPLSMQPLIDLATSQTIWTPDKKVLMHVLPNLGKISRDIYSIEYLTTGQITAIESFVTPVHRQMYSTFDTQRNVNRGVPLLKHIEWMESAIKHYQQWCIVVDDHNSTSFEFLSNIAIPALQFIESSGLHVESDLAIKKYDARIKPFISKTNLVFSQYNLYTTTGRCSNKFGGINFAALNKKDETRSIFTSRFDSGRLVLADFESFHLRLIGDMINYQFPLDVPVHQYLGQQYFNKSSLTQAEYDESKSITFKLLYGDERSHDVPEFFLKVYEYIDMLMVWMDQSGYIVSPYFKRRVSRDRIYNPSPAKIFNYMIQLAETERNMIVLNKLQSIFSGLWSRPILYTYDSVLFDFDMSDGPECIRDAIKILSEDGKYPMRVYQGIDYHTLKEFTL